MENRLSANATRTVVVLKVRGYLLDNLAFGKKKKKSMSHEANVKNCVDARRLCFSSHGTCDSPTKPIVAHLCGITTMGVCTALEFRIVRYKLLLHLVVYLAKKEKERDEKDER